MNPEPVTGEQSLTPVDVEGLEEFFDPVGGQSVASGQQTLTTDGQVVATVSEASRLLQIPYSTLRRQVKQGKFETVTGADGKPRVVLPDDLATAGGQPVASIQETATSGGQTVATAQADRLVELVERQSKELQAASCRIGWLESQLQEREKEIKLLTDSEHKKVVWWRSAWAWFVGTSD